MFRDALIIFRKEAGNVLRDRGAIFANYLLPLILMPVIFGVLGSVNKLQEDSHKETTYQVAFAGPRDSGFESLLQGALKYDTALVAGDPTGITVTFPEGHVAGAPGEVKVAFNSTREDLSYAGQVIQGVLATYNAQLSAQLLKSKGLAPADLTPLKVTHVELSAPEVQGSQGIAFLLPYMILLMLFAGSMGLGLAVTTGEKEKGSLASLLVNQVSRTSIAVGKILFVLVSGLVNAATSALGVLGGIYLQVQLSGGAGGPLGSFGALANPVNFAVLSLSIGLASIVAASIIVSIGVFAKNMKQATGYITPVYIVVIVGALTGSTLDTGTAFWMHLVPLLNTALVIKAAILGALEPVAVLMTVGVNLVVGAGLVFLTARAFESEAVLSTV